MHSVADEIRRERADRERSLPAEERILRALALHRRDVESFRTAHDPPLSPVEAARLLQRERRRGRVHSACIEALEG